MTQLTIPPKGRPAGSVLSDLASFKVHDLPWREGRTFAYVYPPGDEVDALAKQAYVDYLTENALDPTVYPSLLRLETEVVRMAASHLSGGPEVVGNFTTGGTESCMLSVKTARDYARAERGIKEPKIILPVTAHACFQKACHYFDIEPVIVPVAAPGFRVDPKDMEAAIDDRTIMMIGSAFQYAHGVVDPIEALGQIALRRNLLLHVDGCIGGFVLNYFRRLGRDIPRYDFAVPGVTQMSMDFHKYAYAPKGASVVLYRDKELRRHQIYTCATWTGYSVTNATILSTKSGGPLAACWAVLNHLGDDGYLEFARRTLEATDRILAALRAIPGLRVMGEPDGNLIAFTADEFSIFPITDLMRERGWFVQPQLGFFGSKENIHLSINQATLPNVEPFLKDLREVVAKVAALPRTLDEQMRQMLQGIDPKSFGPADFHRLMAASGQSAGDLPQGGSAGINELFNTVPAEVTGKILTEYFNELYVWRDSPERVSAA